MSWNEPDHLPDLPNPWDAPEREPCSVCDGEGEECMSRGVWQRCGWCNGTGDEPEAGEPDDDSLLERGL